MECKEATSLESYFLFLANFSHDRAREVIMLCFEQKVLAFNPQERWFCFYDFNCHFVNASKLRDSASSFHWLSSSIFSYCSSFVPHRWHRLSSPLYDVSVHTNHIFSVERIWSWQHFSVNISSVAELSPVYCCLVCIYFSLGIFWSHMLHVILILIRSCLLHSTTSMY